MDMSNHGIGQWSKIMQCFETYLQLLETLCLSENVWRELGDTGEVHGKITSGVYVHEDKKG